MQKLQKDKGRVSTQHHSLGGDSDQTRFLRKTLAHCNIAPYYSTGHSLGGEDRRDAFTRKSNGSCVSVIL
ncbi:MAG: hypothetical protein ABSA79_06600 [Candidatus Bathyarchaeia archaeon]|jgi:hypothetical protein